MEGGPSGQGGGPNKEIWNLRVNAAMQHIKLAKEHEASEKYEAAYNHFVAASSKLMELLKSCDDPAKQEVFKKHLNECITSAGFLKVIIRDKKAEFKQQ